MSSMSARRVTRADLISRRHHLLCSGAGFSGPDTQPVDEDVDKPQDTGLPAGLIVHVAHAEKGPEQVFRADVVADFAACDRSIEQRADGPRQLVERIGEQFRVFVGSKSERRRHALFCSNELHIRAHPVTERLDRRHLSFQPIGQIGELLHFAAVHRFEQGFARGEMPVEGADADTGRSRDGFEAGLGTTGAENLWRPQARARGSEPHRRAAFASFSPAASYGASNLDPLKTEVPSVYSSMTR